MSDLVLSVDCSTSGAKAFAWALDGILVATGATELALSIPQPGFGEQDPLDWWSGVVTAVRACVASLDEPNRVKAIAVTHQRESFACLDADGEPIRPAMLWLDARAGEQVERFGTARIHELTGKPANPTPAFYKLLWLAEHEPETLAHTAHVVDVHAYLAHKLTGLWRTSTASADPLGLVDLASADYSDEILAIARLSRAQLPELVVPGELLGELGIEAAEELGLEAGIPVISGAGDGQSAGLGAGIVTADRAYLNLGTGLISGSYSDTYLPRTAYRAMAGTVPGSVNYELFVGAGTFMISWFMSTFAEAQEVPAGTSREVWWQEQAAQIEPGANGLFVVPYWNGQLTPLWDYNARGVMCGFSGLHTSAHIYRAVLEGIAFELRVCLEHAEPDLPERLTEFVTMGGGARSPLWCQMFADILNRPIVLAGSDEATALGAAILASVGSGLHANLGDAVSAMTSVSTRFEPNSTAVARYDELFAVYRELYPALRPVFAQLAKARDEASASERVKAE